ncbi:MAG: hypothetical protein JW716_03450 [Candidatus Aenigmarchaeota archaeon]|nr:hypothetical protein [Candidatus Aenigmarchaeota archaeon]
MEVERFEWKEEAKRRIPDLKRYILILTVVLITVAIITALILFPPDLSIFSFNQPSIEDISSELTISPARNVAEEKYIMTIGEESTINFSFLPDKTGEVKSSIELPPGVQLISGEMQLNDSIQSNQTNSLNAYIRAVRVGKWTIKGLVITDNGTFEKSFDLCIDVLEENARDRCK